MDDDMIERHLENLDRRLARVEQILPTLATKEELLATEGKLHLAIAEAVAPLATRRELDDRLAAQSAELRREIQDEGARSRRYMDVLIEGQRGDIQILAAHLSVVMERLTDT